MRRWIDVFRSRDAEAGVRLAHDPETDPAQQFDSGDRTFEAAWRTLIKRRLVLLLGLLLFWSAAIEARLLYLQIVRHGALAEQARRQQERVIPAVAPRGDIVDRNGVRLAFSVDAYAIGADPTLIPADRKASTAVALCRALRDCTAREQREILQSLSRTDTQFVSIRRARNVAPDAAAEIDSLKLAGVIVSSETRRYYPQMELAAHILGFVSENGGAAGIEETYDDAIKGQNGLLLVHYDGQNRMGTSIQRPPEPGATLELTLDVQMQHIAERELQAGVEAHRARAGTAIVMNPHTGEILALANYPAFNPNTYFRSPADTWRNRALQEIYEPGSTFKIVTASAAIEEGVLRPTDLIDCSPGYITFGGRRIPDEHRYGVLTFEDVIIKSSNVGAIKAGLRVGAERISRYVRRFGFGETHAPDFRGATRGIVHPPASLNDSALASVSMGYQVSVTALQMAMAVSSIANGGELLEPRIVRAVVRDGVREPVRPRVLRRSIEPETAATLTAIMEGVVERGTAKTARLDRYQVAGKTGTSKKAVPGGYSGTDRMSSFVGFVPSRRPAFTILVVIDTPRAGSVYGGTVAAPVFHRIADGLLRLTGTPPTINPERPVVLAADGEASRTPGVRPVSLTPVMLPSDSAMPDVRGFGAREALQVLTRAGLLVNVSGSGMVTSQFPEPGDPIEPGIRAQLRLRREAVVRDAPPPADGR
jgi:cell division protein FtsI (penicillin-binding protein 3)